MSMASMKRAVCVCVVLTGLAVVAAVMCHASQGAPLPGAPSKASLSLGEEAYGQALEVLYGEETLPDYRRYDPVPWKARHMKSATDRQAWQRYVNLYLFTLMHGQPSLALDRAFTRFMSGFGEALVMRRLLDGAEIRAGHMQDRLDLLPRDKKKHDQKIDVMNERDGLRVKVKLACEKLKKEAREVETLMAEHKKVWDSFVGDVRSSDAYRHARAQRLFEQAREEAEAKFFAPKQQVLDRLPSLCEIKGKEPAPV
ncbi:hypothetical protein EIL50_02865 [bacterium NHP-B]|nr:hypothetical protein EIL50_02865 [bacterium NHP-B]